MYADVAMTLSRYLVSQKHGGRASTTSGFEIVNVKIQNPLIAGHLETSHLFRIEATASWSRHVVSMELFSVDVAGKHTTSHVKLDVNIVSEQRWLAEWKRGTYLITSRIDALIKSSLDTDANNDCNTIKRKMIYKLFSALVDYSDEYRGMSEVTIDSGRLEAVAKVSFQVTESGFFIDPRWIDSLGQVAG